MPNDLYGASISPGNMGVSVTLNSKNCELSRREWMAGVSIEIIAIFDNNANEDHKYVPDYSKVF